MPAQRLSCGRAPSVSHGRQRQALGGSNSARGVHQSLLTSAEGRSSCTPSRDDVRGVFLTEFREIAASGSVRRPSKLVVPHATLSVPPQDVWTRAEGVTGHTGVPDSRL